MIFIRLGSEAADTPEEDARSSLQRLYGVCGRALFWRVLSGRRYCAVPVRRTELGDEAALLTTWTEADCVPVAVGAKVTEMVQEAPVARLAGQLLVWLKLLFTAPGTPMLVSVSGALPVPEFVSVMLLATEVELTGRVAKVMEVGEKLTAGEPVTGGAVPVPDTFAEFLSWETLSVAVT